MSTTRLDHGQRARVITLIEGLTWRELERSLKLMETTLRLALEATSDSLPLWHAHGQRSYGHEFCLSPGDVADLSEQWRLAYVAQLLTTLAHAYGVGAPCPHGPPAVWDDDGQSPATLLRGINDITWGL